MPFVKGLVAALGPVTGKRVLELGVRLWAAKQGADVTGVDIGANLVEPARALAEVNRVAAAFDRVDIATLPFRSERARK